MCAYAGCTCVRDSFCVIDLARLLPPHHPQLEQKAMGVQIDGQPIFFRVMRFELLQTYNTALNPDVFSSSVMIGCVVSNEDGACL